MLAPHRFAALLGALALASACDLQSLLDDVDHPRTAVDVMVTHHATVENGVFPDRGGDGEMRVFTSDEGWTIQLLQAIVVTSGATLHQCDDESIDIEMYWGPLPEEINDRDLDTLTLGSAEFEDAEFCGMTVHYGPYIPGDDAAPRSTDKIDGATVYLYGGATKDDVTVPFEIRVTESISVDLDLSRLDGGGPVHVSGADAFPTDLTLGKTYDRFFDGIDFSTVTQADLEAQVLSVLALETSANLGARVVP